MRERAPASGRTGNRRASRANIRVKLSSGPNTTEGRNSVQPPVAPNTRWMAASPSPLERRYMLGPPLSAPNALTCNMRATPLRTQAWAMRSGNSTCARAKPAP
ncbi:Uncharacterised protein [Bordetella pertussis]|nr:Uncharacterised protein [Bordetella pertussis]CFL87218.1 Uncharacterised protein [Bordetella pertussis]CFM09845.1 Uncharacterised protein [Bordetella pertussis]CFM39893.1 Uncharacterised protein [Bordetella pertussis]CFM74428.1 Uncharacterised protein [Bordetella pertussis]